MVENTERWVPYHTVLGVHELFLMEEVHNRKDWSEKQRFIAIFVFRAHCKRDLFLKAQVPLMTGKFWKDPAKFFADEGPMEKAIAAYRKKTKQALLTNCFRIIPERILKDNDANLVRSIVRRSARLMPLAESAFEIVKDAKLSAYKKLTQISKMIQDTEGCGDTWAKMLTVCIDLAYPQEKLLEADCDVGTGAAPPLQCLLGKKLPDRRQGLRHLLGKVNHAKSASARLFWTYLTQVEKATCREFRHLPLVQKQAKTKPGHMSAATLQVQLCEYRQFRHSVARNVYGLPDDATMRAEESCRISPENLVQCDKSRVFCEFHLESESRVVKMEVPIKAFASMKVASRVLMIMIQKVQGGASQSEVAKLRDQLSQSYVHSEDVPDSSEAWRVCKAQLSGAAPVVGFHIEKKDGSMMPFQTTVMAADGNLLHAERIARLCFELLRSGKDKETVVKFRNEQYAKLKQLKSKRKRE
ncbi:unnamed protein product [Effrenium voratum]|nr:unnamed protein product [Effrenium voratum]